MFNVEIRDGRLYCDIENEDFGEDLPDETETCHIQVIYPQTIWESFGALAVKIAQNTCPVLTGYLRDHIGYAADKGGVEIWSDAPYSAYQEYGTSHMMAQPYFESAIEEAAALLGVEGVLRSAYLQAKRYEEEIINCYTLAGRVSSSQEMLYRIYQLQNIIAMMKTPNEEGIYYDTTPLEEALVEFQAHYAEMRQREEMMELQEAAVSQSFFGAILQGIIQGIVGGLVNAVIWTITLPAHILAEALDIDTHHPSHY